MRIKQVGIPQGLGNVFLIRYPEELLRMMNAKLILVFFVTPGQWYLHCILNQDLSSGTASPLNTQCCVQSAIGPEDRRQRAEYKGGWSGDGRCHVPTKVKKDLAWGVLFFLSGWPTALKQLWGTTTELSLGNFFPQWREVENSRVKSHFPLFCSYSSWQLSGIKCKHYWEDTEKKHGERENCGSQELFLPTLSGKAGPWNQQKILPFNWYRKLVWRKDSLGSMTFYFYLFPKGTYLSYITWTLTYLTECLFTGWQFFGVS